MYNLKIHLEKKILVFTEIEEYAPGFKYFFMRSKTGKTHSVKRSKILQIYRELKNGELKPILLRSFRRKE